jgi:hypothetical protein
MRVFLAAVMIMLSAATAVALSAATALAQDHVPRYGEADKEKSQGEIEADKRAERAYKRSLGNIPNQGPTDPWGAVRTNDASKTSTPVAKTPKAKTKTGTANN